MHRLPKVVIVDFQPLMKRLDADRPFEAAVYETWLAHQYTKAHWIPCQSVSLLEYIPNDFPAERERLVNLAKELDIWPLSILPYPSDMLVYENGLSFWLDDGFLVMGKDSVIERAWRNMPDRIPRYRELVMRGAA